MVINAILFLLLCTFNSFGCDDKREVPIGYRIILFEDKEQKVEAKVIKVSKHMCPHEQKVQFLLPSGAITEFYKDERRVILDLMIMDAENEGGNISVVNGNKAYSINIVI